VSLYVSKRGAKSFRDSCHSDADGSVAKTVRCAYRIVARRKDIKAPRLAKVKLSDAPDGSGHTQAAQNPP